MGLQNDGLAAKEIDAPQTVFRMAQEGKPGRPTGIGGRLVVGGERAAHHIFVDFDIKDGRELLGNARTAIVGIPTFHLDDGLNELWRGTLGTGFPAPLRGKQPAVLPRFERAMKLQERGWVHDNRGPEQSAGMQHEGAKTHKAALERRQLGCSARPAVESQELLFEAHLPEIATGDLMISTTYNFAEAV